MNQYDNPEFFAEYAKMSRSQYGLQGEGEWHQLELLFPELSGKAVLDLGCGYGWHCKYAADHGAASILGIDQSELMIEEAKRRNADGKIEYRMCGIQDFANRQTPMIWWYPISCCIILRIWKKSTALFIGR